VKIEIYEKLILRVIFYGCETWSLIRRAFQNRVR